MDMAQRASSTAKKPRLTAENWADAALAAMREGGLAAVAVEPLAARLGTTKGSFYWHFTGRDALIEAALRRWAQTETEATIAALEAEPDPERRLRALFVDAVESATADTLEVSLLATADDPRVASVLKEVTRRRIAYVSEQFAALGFDSVEAHRRGLQAYSVYLGHTQLGHAVPEALPSGPDLAAYLDSVIDPLVRRD
ncbi:TetR/AcrR family transcriptional regulator [Streptomyces sp. NA04227]|uniref:TetR/AcrR family transcriptional regulator n=1 Tax=Streptomyces sp. NA04227 TaxID=2742136 RepID=UPI001591EA3A|nr:TetR/AcrR family transcriptional regulator [Streptomyces sp. NA04227]QKW06023.1 TetR/AcrR family transcriptional regulator [Streptomyces sp. NA04227]